MDCFESHFNIKHKALVLIVKRDQILIGIKPLRIPSRVHLEREKTLFDTCRRVISSILVEDYSLRAEFLESFQCKNKILHIFLVRSENIRIKKRCTKHYKWINLSSFQDSQNLYNNTVVDIVCTSFLNLENLSQFTSTSLSPITFYQFTEDL